MIMLNWKDRIALNCYNIWCYKTLVTGQFWNGQIISYPDSALSWRGLVVYTLGTFEDWLLYLLKVWIIIVLFQSSCVGSIPLQDWQGCHGGGKIFIIKTVGKNNISFLVTVWSVLVLATNCMFLQKLLAFAWWVFRVGLVGYLVNDPASAAAR